MEFKPNICRVCLGDHLSMMFSLYDVAVTDSKVNSFADMLNLCTNLQAFNGDDFPSLICLSCKDALNNAYRFKQLAEESDWILRDKKENRKPKIVFQNLNELKFKMQGKMPIKNQMSSQVEENLSDLVLKGAIGSTSIQKIESFSDSGDDDLMGVDDFDDDYFPYLRFKKEKNQCVKENKPDVENSRSQKTNEESLKTGKKRRKTNKSKTYETYFKTGGSVRKRYGYIEFEKPIPIQVSSKIADMKCGTVQIEKVTNEKKEKKKKLQKKKKTVKTRNLPNGRLKIDKPNVALKPCEKLKDVCSICGVQTYTLKAHLLTHKDKASYECDYCSKKYSRKDSIRSHILGRHLNIRNEICNLCGAAYHNKKSLYRHKKIHEEKKYKCSMCPKAFVQRNLLKRHIWTHTGYKPYSCDVCGRLFSTSQILRTHIRSHTKEKPYSCEVCHMRFTYKVNLNDHTIKVHNVNIRYKQIHTITLEILSDVEKCDPQCPEKC